MVTGNPSRGRLSKRRSDGRVTEPFVLPPGGRPTSRRWRRSRTPRTFEEVGERRRYYPDGEDAVIMTLSLGGDGAGG